MTEDQIERMVEQKMNRLDNRLMRNELSQDAYELAVKALDQWAEELFATKPQAKRYQVVPIYQGQTLVYTAWDTETATRLGTYPTSAKAKARVRTLNSRNGGK